MNFVGIDPGITTTAVVALDANGAVLSTFTCSPDWEHKEKRIEPQRLRFMVRATFKELRRIAVANGDYWVAIEEPFVGKQGKIAFAATALKQYAVFAALLDRLIEACPPGTVAVVPPTTLKTFVGAKKKMFVAREVMRRWEFTHDDHNVVDAYAIARWCQTCAG